MGGCQSNQYQQVESPVKTNNSSLILSKNLDKHRFIIPIALGNKLDVVTDNGKITDYITKNNFQQKNTYQIIDIRDSLGQDNKFVDYDFIAQNVSLGTQPLADHVHWHRPDKFFDGPYQVFEGKIQPADIKQGRLSNCYYLSALCAISQYSFIVKRIFQTVEYSSYGIYGIWLFIDGFWQCIVLDDYFPIYKNKPLYCRNHGNQLWVMLLEKAYAKVFGSYQAIETGLTGVALNTLTGAPYQYLCKDSSFSISSQRAWKFITQNLAKNYLLNGSTQNNDRNGYFGLISTHCYAILDSREVRVNKEKGSKKQKILKLSNPWGKYEWNGRWSQESNVWTQELKRKLNYEKKDDGIFWMNIDDFVSNFGQICVCKYNKNYINTSIPLKFSKKENSFKCIYMGVPIITQGSLTIFQKDHHHFLQGQYQYSLIRVIVMQFNTKSRTFQKYISDAFDCDKDTSMQLKLSPGQYYILVQVDWKSQCSREVTLNFYGQNSVSFIIDQNPIQIQDLFRQIVIIHQNYVQEDRVFIYQKQPNIKRVTGSIAGYVYYHYTNRSKKNKYLYQNVYLKQRNQIVVHGQQRLGDFTVKVFPGEQRFMRLKVQKQGNSYYSFSTRINYYIVDRYSLDKLRDIVQMKSIKIKKRQLEGKQINVIVKTYQYSGGIAILYQNRLQRYVFIEELNFEIDNLQLQNRKTSKPGQIILSIPPKQQRLVSFLIIRPDRQISFKTKISFELKIQENKDE